jgi:hypothetical protein
MAASKFTAAEQAAIDDVATALLEGGDDNSDRIAQLLQSALAQDNNALKSIEKNMEPPPGLVAIVKSCPQHYKKTNLVNFNNMVSAGALKPIKGPSLIIDEPNIPPSQRAICIPRGVTMASQLSAVAQKQIVQSLISAIAANPNAPISLGCQKFTDREVCDGAKSGTTSGTIVKDADKERRLKAARAAVDTARLEWKASSSEERASKKSDLDIKIKVYNDATTDAPCQYFRSGCFSRALLKGVAGQA